MAKILFTGEEYHSSKFSASAPGEYEVDADCAAYLTRTFKKWFSLVEEPKAPATQEAKTSESTTQDPLQDENPSEKAPAKVKPAKKGNK
jgi:hypothetical protein